MNHNITQVVSNSKPDPRAVTNPSSNIASKPDWLLYTVPASAFVIGVVLFSFVCKTQRHRNAATKWRKQTNGHSATTFTFGGETGRYMESAVDSKKDDTQSYENVEAAIYSNQEKASYYVPADEDYLNPDAIGEEEVMGREEHLNTTQPPSNLTEMDGASYENMLGCVYAQPRKLTKRIQNNTEDDDYINPDDTGKEDLALDHTDTESYEMMDGSDCIYNNSDLTATQEDDSYELMNGITG